MTLKVVRTTKEATPLNQPQHEGENVQNRVQSASHTAITSVVRNSEAAITQLKNNRAAVGISAEKIRDYKEAKEVADDLSDRIKESSEEKGLDVHSSLDSVAAREHLA